MIYYVYIMTNKPRGVIYIGVTNYLQRRVLEHKGKKIEGFTKKYNLTKLVYVQNFRGISEAINFEKKLKRWHRSWKINLIEDKNPEWHDLYNYFFNFELDS